ncbi:hypothetical protein B0H17DRAFT_1079471, partial [Mycena rosella]
MRSLSGLFLTLLLSFAAAQDGVTVTTTDALGETVVEVATTDINGIPTTSILTTLLPTGVTTTLTVVDPAGETVVEVVTGDGVGDTGTQTITTLLATTAPVAPPVGPVGQPGDTPDAAGAVTPYTYTTTDAAGDTIAATVLDYSAYTASYATQIPANNANANGNSNDALQRSPGWWGLGLSV